MPADGESRSPALLSGDPASWRRACSTSRHHDGPRAVQEDQMGSGAVDKAKGRVKEAAGALADDDRLRNEGKLDQAAGAVKDAAEKVVDKVKDAVRRVKQ
jgi:uncharacterized protein YjbJ (UPF0337 family)